MAKISIKRPRIISKKFPEVNSTIDGVEKSLNDLVFTYSEHIDRTLQKKHIMMAVSSMVLLIVLGSFISPRGKAESSVFYPDTCLGGWVNPQYAQGEQETTSNGDETQFTKHNSAVLPKNTDAEMYCGNFKGKFDQTTKPTKIIVSLALTKGADLLAEDMLESGVVASSSVIGVSSTTAELMIASSTASSAASSTPELSASSTDSLTSSSTAGEVIASSTTETSTSSTGPATATAVPSAPIQETASAIGSAFDSLKNSIVNLFENNKDSTPVTDTVVVPPPPVEPAPAPAADPVPTPAPAAPASDAAPTSYVPFVGSSFLSLFFQKVFAEEITTTTTTIQDPASVQQPITPVQVVAEPKGVDIATSTTASEVLSAETRVSAAPTSSDVPSVTPSAESILGQITSTTSSFFATTSEATTTEILPATTTESVVPPVEDNQFQNNFLEVIYTFDGVTWTSLGELNEISMKYRTFEIPVTATTSWRDMSRLQVKIIAKKHDLDTPTVYLDAIKVEVLYETAVIHEHPDFARDDILKDQSGDGVRVLNINNNDNGANEIWYTTIDTQGAYGVAPGSWVQVNLDQVSQSYQLIDIYGQNIFWVDTDQKILWVTNLQKETNDGVGLILPSELTSSSTEILNMGSASSTAGVTSSGTTTVSTNTSSTTENITTSSSTIAVVPSVASTTVIFTKANGEEWYFEYNSITKKSAVRIKN